MSRPEDKIRSAVKEFLELRGWVVKIIHGSVFQEGLPDLYATHKVHGPRWIEIKLPSMKGSRWTVAQTHWFPRLIDNGTPIWVLCGATEEQYKKLFEPSNFLEMFLCSF